MALRGEPHVAVFGFAKVWLFSGVKAQMGFQVTFFVKGLVAAGYGADIVSDASMLLHVNFEALGATIGLAAVLEGANEGLLLVVREHVVFEMAARHESFVAIFVLAFERLFAGLLKKER